MRTIAGFLAYLILTLFVSTATAHEYKQGALSIVHPWSRPVAAGIKTGAAYLSIRNDGKEADRFIGVKTDVCDTADMHATIQDGDVMKMRKLEGGVALQPGTTVKFEPGGMHIMLMGLKQPLNEGSSFPMTLIFEKAGEVPVEVKIENKSVSGPEDHSAQHH